MMGCTRNALVSEIPREEAANFRPNVYAIQNPGLEFGKQNYNVLAEGNPLSLYERTKEPRRNATEKTKDAVAATIEETPLWIQIDVAAGILDQDNDLEKFEQGELKARLDSGETFTGHYRGYRPRGKEHCTRTSLANFFYFDSRGAPPPRQGGVAVLTGDRGTKLLCAYGWRDPHCERNGICGEKEGKYYRLAF